VFTACAQAPLAGLALALPALVATGLIDTVHEVYGEFYSLDTMLCEAVFRALLGEAHADAAARVDRSCWAGCSRHNNNAYRCSHSHISNSHSYQHCAFP
jgi:hypothetical protein